MAITPNPEPSKTSVDFPLDQLAQQPTWYVNLTSGRIAITEDKVELYLKEYAESATATTEVYVWLGILITIVLTLVTASFHSFLGFPGEVWTAVFLMSAVATVAFCARAYKRSRNALTIKDTIHKMAQGSTAQTNTVSRKSNTQTSSTISTQHSMGAILQTNPQRWYSIIRVLGTIVNAFDTTSPNGTTVITMDEVNIGKCCMVALADLDGAPNPGHRLQAKLMYREIIAACNAVPDAKVTTEPEVCYRMTVVQTVVNKMIQQAGQAVGQG